MVRSEARLERSSAFFAASLLGSVVGVLVGGFPATFLPPGSARFRGPQCEITAALTYWRHGARSSVSGLSDL
jgi:hypothetical protein